MARRYQIEGMRELERTIRRLGKLPQKCVNKATKKGANIALKDARKNAPVETGELKRGIISKPEKTRKRGKKVHQVVMDAKKNDIFVVMTNDGKRYYYPASMEYGFIAKDGRYVPGYNFLRDSIDNNKRAIEKEMVDVLAQEIDKLR